MADPSGLEHPEQIGPYRILHVIGEGGMGVVYDAEQKEPVRRRVAVKMMKAGLDTREVVARFEAERQALAVMEHPGIAKVLDAGATELGRPYFVMELVRGVRIDDYCDQKQLSVRARVELAIKVCEAVQHAHHKGVIHRDLKPTNVLVAEANGAPTPKIIDFGIAKATGHQLTPHTIVTTQGQALGTLAYMSPEQASGRGEDADTRSDVYSLGILLYELLTGNLPLDPKDMGGPAFLAQLSARDVTLPTPWARLARLGRAEQDALARARGVRLEALRRDLQGDLRWIVHKATEKDRNLRYETANGLAMDLRRYLDDQPIVARPPTARYRVAKFVRRNRVSVAAVAAVVAGLVVGLVGTSVGFVRARAAEQVADQQRLTANRALEFMIGMFAGSDPVLGGGPEVTARAVLDGNVARIDSLSDQPDVQSRLLQAMGAAYTSLGEFARADSLLRRAVDVRTGLGDGDAALESSVRQLAWLLLSQGRPAEARPLAERSLELAEEVWGHDDPTTADALQVMGMIERDLGDYGPGEEHLLRSLDIREAAFGDGHILPAWSLYHLGWLYVSLERYPEADDVYRRILPTFESEFGPEHPSTLSVLSDYAAVLAYGSSSPDSALAVQLRVLAGRESAFGVDHVLVGQVLNNIGNSLLRLDRPDEALERFDRALAIYESAYPAGSVEIVRVFRNISGARLRIGDPEGAVAAARRALAESDAVFGLEHGERVNGLRILATALRGAGREEEAARADAEADGVLGALRQGS